MRLPPDFIDCVAFLCERGSDDKSLPGGTGFFVEFQDAADPARMWVYLVTALHVIEAIKGRSVYVRINTLPSVKSAVGFEDIETSKDDWFLHDTADVAIIPSPANPTRHAIQRIPLDIFIDNRYRFDVARLSGRGNPVLEPLLRGNFPDGIEVQVGDELFSPGLFVQSAGKNRNLPVVRFGNVARMPGDELVILDKGQAGQAKIRAYLAEMHSWGGYSGSPIFWHYEYNMTIPVNVPRWRAPQSTLSIEAPPQPERIDLMWGRGWANALLGIVSGHFGIPTKARDKQKETIQEVITELNAGIAILTPAENIKELVMRDDVEKERRKRAEAFEEPSATADYSRQDTQRTRAKRSKDRIDIPTPTKRQFESDLLKATRKRKPS